jgi:hypothetical protein
MNRNDSPQRDDFFVRVLALRRRNSQRVPNANFRVSRRLHHQCRSVRQHVTGTRPPSVRPVQRERQSYRVTKRIETRSLPLLLLRQICSGLLGNKEFLLSIIIVFPVF